MSRVLRSSYLPVLAASLAAVASLTGTAAGSAAGVPATNRVSPGASTWSAHLGDADGVTAGVPVTVVGGASYAFSSVVAGQPVRWNPCAPIHWRANVARGPVGGLDVLKAAVAHIASTTGTTWVFDGVTLTVPSTAYLPTNPTNTNKPVLIGWTDGASSDLLRGQPAQVLGMTRTTWFGVDDGLGHRAAATRAAVVALDRTDHLALRGVQSWSATALHELGHVMGLDHPADSRQLMAATLPNVSTLQAGDNAGLKRLGRSAGCVTIPGA